MTTRQNPWFTFFTLAAMALGGLYWLTALSERPDDPWSTVLFYRHGDPDYFGMIFRLLETGYGDFTLAEHQHQGVASFPFFAQFPYQVLVFLLGKAGFALADLLVSGARYIALYLLVGLVMPSPFARAGWAFALFAFFSAPFTELLKPYFLPWVKLHPLWDFRIAASYVTSVYFLFTVYTFTRLLGCVAGERQETRVFLVHGLTLGLLLQASVHDGLVMAFASGALFLAHVHQTGRLPWVWPAMAGVFLASTGFFWYQLGHASPEMRQLWGAYPHLQDQLMAVVHTTPPVAVGQAVAAFLAAAFYRRLARDEPSAQARHHLFLALGILLTLAITASLLFTMLHPQGIQDYHLLHTYLYIKGLFQAACALLIVDLLGRVGLVAPSAPRWARPLLAGGVALLAVTVHADHHRERHRVETQERLYPHPSGLHSGWPAIPGYRRDFNQLARLLEQRPPGGVLGTLDFQLGQWWVALCRGYVYLPDTFASLTSQAEIEARLFSFLKLHRVSREQLAGFLETDYFVKRFHSLSKYQANRFHLFAPLSDYPARSLDTIYRAMYPWNLVVPESEKRRILAAYEAFPPGLARLDFIVVVKPSLLAMVPGEGFVKTWENATFAVYDKVTVTGANGG